MVHYVEETENTVTETSAVTSETEDTTTETSAVTSENENSTTTNEAETIVPATSDEKADEMPKPGGRKERKKTRKTGKIL